MSDITTNNITQRCVSLANGDLSSDLRVNYEFGLVLGVDEFRQEQLYFLQKDYLHNRGLHGYGTVSGLNVTLQDQGDDIQITVAPGIGVDQFGRTFIIRHEQCASLGAWFARQQATHNAEIPDPDPKTGERVVYLVGTYDECLDALVRIAGQPCSSNDQTTAASRIRDSFNLTLRFAPPAMPAWDAVRRFALLMARVEIDATLPPEQSAEAGIIAVVRVLDQPNEFRQLNLRLPGEEPPAGAPHSYRIPAEGATAALDRIFTVWATEVRPRIAPDLIEPNAAGNVESGVLLATIRFRKDANSTADHPIIHGASEHLADSVSDTGRPFLLHTQLIQELLLLGNGTESKPTREFATLHVYDPHTVIVWIHHTARITLPEELGDELRLLVNRHQYTVSVELLTGNHNVFLITTEESIPANARVELRFDLKAVGVEQVLSPSTPLFDHIDTLGFNYVGRDGEFIVVYTFAENLPDVREFVSFDTLIEGGVSRIRLWFHAPPPFSFIGDNVTVLVDAERQGVRFSLQTDDGADPSVWLADIGNLVNGTRLTFQFNTDTIRVGEPSLTDLMRKEQFSYLGYDGEHTLTADYIVDIPPAPVIQPGGLTEDRVKWLIGEVKTLPFVTITPFVTPFARSAKDFALLQCELWFHLDQEPLVYQAKVQTLSFQIYAEIGDSLRALVIDRVDRVDRLKLNVFVATIKAPISGYVDGQYTYMRFLFPLEGIQVRTTANNIVSPLGAYIQANNVKFDGYFGSASTHLIAYVRTPLNVEANGQ